MRYLVLILFIGFLLTGGYGSRLFAQENYEIRNVKFHGNKTLSSSFLLDHMGIKKVSGLEKLLTKKQPSIYNETMISLAMERLTRTYQSEGFLDVKDSLLPPEMNNKKQTVKLTINIVEGKPVLVDSVKISLSPGKNEIRPVQSSPGSGSSIQSLNFDSLRKKVIRKLELKKGKRFRDESLYNDVSLIEDALQQKGYAYANVNFSLNLKPESLRTSISYSVIPGPLCYFGETSISGYKHVKESLILKQMDYKAGERYDQSLLSKTRKDLYQLQLFRVASVLPQTDSATQRNPVPVKIYIQESPRVSTRFGVGYGTEDKFRAFAHLTYRGFLGDARRIELALNHSALQPYSADLKLIQPQFLSKKGTLGINPFIGHNTEPGYNIKHFGINVPFTWNFSDVLNSTLTYYLEKVQQQLGLGDTIYSNRESSKFLYNKSGLLLGTVFNNSNPKFSPGHGEYLTLGFKLNGYLFGGDFNYTRLYGDFRAYRQVGDGNWIVAFRIMAGGINSSNSSGYIPVEDRFYAGGANSVRGWSRSELGPKRSDGTPSGGKSIMEGNLEFRFPLVWKLRSVLFMDTGNVWSESYYYRLNELAYAAGTGLRLETPVGPIRFDVGFPIYNKKTSPQFFISVGQAF